MTNRCHWLLGLVLFLSAAAGVTAQDSEAVLVKVNDRTGQAPKEWQAKKPENRLRSYQFILPSGDPDVEDAEVVIFPESNPKPEKSFPRWKASFLPPEGKTLDDVSKQSEKELPDGGTVTFLDVTGTWRYKERPFDPTSQEMLKPDFRAVWAIIADEDEATHVRFSGPQKVVDKYKPGFDKWIESLKK